MRREPALVRRRIGYVGQLGGADVNATGRENLLLAGLCTGPAPPAPARAVRSCSGCSGWVTAASPTGPSAPTLAVSAAAWRSRSASCTGRGVLFLDEPTTGLDPQNRANLWDQVRQLRDGGATVFLTTHYLDEADQLSDRVAIVDHGRVIALGTPDELKRRYSADTISVTPGPGVPEARSSWPGNWPALRSSTARTSRTARSG